MNADMLTVASFAGALGHKSSYRGGIRVVDGLAADAAGGEQAIRTPARHQPGQAGSQCLLCGDEAAGLALCAACGWIASPGGR